MQENKKTTKPEETLCCTSVFKNGKENPIKQEYTAVWIALINRMERNKENVPLL